MRPTCGSRAPSLVQQPPTSQLDKVGAGAGRSGQGSRSALETLLKDIDRIQRAKAAYGDLPRRPDSPAFPY